MTGGRAWSKLLVRIFPFLFGRRLCIVRQLWAAFSSNLSSYSLPYDEQKFGHKNYTSKQSISQWGICRMNFLFTRPTVIFTSWSLVSTRLDRSFQLWWKLTAFFQGSEMAGFRCCYSARTTVTRPTNIQTVLLQHTMMLKQQALLPLHCRLVGMLGRALA